MFYVSILVEALRSRPRLVFWTATLAQTTLWFAVPALLYPAPPERLLQLLAGAHDLTYAALDAPPMAAWLADLAYRAGGGRVFGVYLLAQLCVGVTYWNVFALGRALVGPQQAALAVLLMVGVAAFTVPTPDFGPAILAMAIWSTMLSHFWRAIGEGRPGYWYVVAVEGGALLFVTSSAVILIGLIVLFTLATARGRDALAGSAPWGAAILTIAFLFPPLIWLGRHGFDASDVLGRLLGEGARAANGLAFLRLAALAVAAHAGVALLVTVAGGWPPSRWIEAPALARKPLAALAPRYVAYFALVPFVATSTIAVIAGAAEPIGSTAPLLVLSGLAVVLMAGDGIRVYRQRLAAFAWVGLLLVPALFTALAIAVLPWTMGVDLKVNRPVSAMAAFFGDSFERRTGRPLKIVTGDRDLAALIAASSSRRPRLLDLDAPARLSAVGDQDIARDGAVVVWPASDTLGTPPPAIKRRFPDLVPEVPRVFERPVQGLLPAMRVGWGVIRPEAPPPVPSQPSPAKPPKAQ